MKTNTQKRKTTLFLGIVMTLSLLVLSACSQTDVVGKVSVTSFGAVLDLSDVTTEDRKSVVEGKSVDIGGRRMI